MPNNNDMTVNERLREVLDKIDLSYKDIAKATGVSRNSIYDMIKDGATIKHSFLLDLHKNFDADIFYILLGTENSTRTINDLDDTLTIDDEFTRIPYLRGIKAGAGYGLVEESHKNHYIAFRQYFVKKTLQANAANLLALRIGGNSMEPVLKDGDDILVDRGRLRIREGPPFLIRYSDEVFVKFLSRLPNKRIKVFSANTAFDSFEVTDDDYDFEVIGQVVWHAHLSEFL